MDESSSQHRGLVWKLTGSSRVVHVAFWCLASTLAALVSGVAPLLLWATGAIAHYSTAVVIAILCASILGGGGLTMTLRTGTRLSVQLYPEPEASLRV